MSSPQHTPQVKKHKKHKSDKKDRHESTGGLKLILKVGSQNTPEHMTEFPMDDDMQVDPNDPYSISRHHKKSKKKKKKKDKNKDREKRHRHKEKKRKREEFEGEISVGTSTDDLPANQYAQPLSPSRDRELRTCVIKKIQERTPLSKGLEHLLGLLEKKDPQQFFAWPVTDNIAPGYSTIITQPMDFSTMRQKVEENEYHTLNEFIEDFKLMCTNAMKYNQVDTIYYKASKKLLHHGLKMMVPEKLGWMLNLIPEITSQDVGFEITPELRQIRPQDEHDEDQFGEVKRRMPASKFEAIQDDLTAEEILVKSQIAAREAKAKLSMF